MSRRRPRRNHTPAFKAQVALAAIKGEISKAAVRKGLYGKGATTPMAPLAAEPILTLVPAAVPLSYALAETAV